MEQAPRWARDFEKQRAVSHSAAQTRQEKEVRYVHVSAPTSAADAPRQEPQACSLLTCCCGTADTGSPHGYSHMVGCRYDSSLGQLTKKFINLINKATDGVLDLNHAAVMLQVRQQHRLQALRVLITDLHVFI